MGLKLIQNYLILLIMKLFQEQIKSDEFWNNFEKIVHELAPINKRFN